MCGIAGIISFQKPKQSLNTSLSTMLSAIKHRGPDGQGEYFHANVALGHVRLSIIDLSNESNQPFMSENSNYIIVFNGEIYNYLELKNELSDYFTFRTNSDTEVLLNAYINWGEDCLDKLNGMFSFIIYDKKKETLFGARDRYGIKPFFYYNNSKYFVFGSEIKAILKSGLYASKLNEKLLYEFLAFNRTDHLQETCFSGILNLRPGHKITIDRKSNSVIVKKWYSLPKLNNINESFSESKINLLERLRKSILLHLVSDVSVGSALSGGLDSSAIVALMREQIHKNPIHAFSAIYDTKWEKDEQIYVEANKAEKNLNVHYVQPNAEKLLYELDELIYQQEEPFASASMFASWEVYKKANKKSIKVLLNGQGADEVFAYDYMAAFYFYELFRKLKFISLIKELCLFKRKQLSGSVFTFKLFLFLLLPKVLKSKAVKFSAPVVNRSFVKKHQKNSDFFNVFFKSKSLNENVVNHINMKLHHLLRVEDKNSMRFSVEARVPFLEAGVVEYGLNIPSRYKVRNGEVKYILKEAMKGLIPELVYKRNNKIGYATPMDLWFRKKDFISYIDSLLKMEKQPMEPFLDITFIKNKWETHKLSKENNGDIIWKYLFLTRWYLIFFKS